MLLRTLAVLFAAACAVAAPSGKLTNAERIARGLPLAAPRRAYDPTRVRAPASRRSAAVGAYTIEAHSSTTGNLVGYLYRSSTTGAFTLSSTDTGYDFGISGGGTQQTIAASSGSWNIGVGINNGNGDLTTNAGTVLTIKPVMSIDGGDPYGFAFTQSREYETSVWTASADQGGLLSLVWTNDNAQKTTTTPLLFYNANLGGAYIHAAMTLADVNAAWSGYTSADQVYLYWGQSA